MIYDPILSWLLISFIVLIVTGIIFREYNKRKRESHYGYPPKP